MSENFKLYSKYYDLLYKDKDYINEANYIEACIKSNSLNAKNILEFGSGTGIHGLMLEKKGFSVFGIERSLDMVEKAQKNGLSCLNADITSFKLGKTFDVVIALFHVISYITENEDLLAVFEHASSHLSEEGLFIFDVWYSPAVSYLKPENRIKRVSTNEIEIIRFAAPIIHTDRNVIDVNYLIMVRDISTNLCVQIEEQHPMRHFSIQEIKLLALLSGFELLKAEEFLTCNKPSEKTWGVNFILKKK